MTDSNEKIKTAPSLNTRRRQFLKENGAKKRLLRLCYFVLLCLNDASTITASLMLGTLVDRIETNSSEGYLVFAILAPTLFLLSAFLSFFGNRCASLLSIDGFNALKVRVFKQILFNPSLTKRFRSGELVRIASDDTQLLGASYLTRPLAILESIAAFCVYLAIIVYYAAPLTLIYLIINTVLVLIVIKINKSVAVWHKKQLEAMGQVDSEMLTIISGARMIERLDEVASNYLLRRFNKTLKLQHKISIRYNTLNFINNMIWVIYLLILPSLLTIFGIILSSYNLMTLSGALMMLSITSYISTHVSKVQTQLQSIQTDNKTFERVSEIL